MFYKKNYFKPFFKKILKFKENYFFYPKILNFKKKKWKFYLNYLKKYLLKNKYQKFKFIDQNKYLLNIFYNRKIINYKNKFRLFFNFYKILKIFYFKIKKKNRIKNKLFNYINKRLDFILVTAKFCFSLKSAKQLIYHGFVLINNKKTKKKSYLLKTGDLIKYNLKTIEFEKKLVFLNKWPIPEYYLIINYKTKEIIFINNKKINNFLLYFPSYLNLYKNTCFYSSVW